MRVLQAHPLAELFPLMDEATFKALVTDIRENGIREAIYLWEGQILDGRNRYNACRELGISPITRHWDGPGDPLDFVVSKNLHRRHLDETQRATVAGKIANMKQGGTGANQHTGADRPIGRSAQEAKVSTVQAAKMMNVGERSVRRARVVLEKGIPDLQKVVEAGGVSLNAAAAVACMQPEEQQEIVRQGPDVIKQAAKTAKARPKLTIVAPAPEPPKTKHGGTIPVPEGSTVEVEVRKAMALEAGGTATDKAARACGIGEQTYRRVRELIVLHDEIELRPSDKQAVANAITAINETRQLTAHASVAHIVRQVWGSHSKYLHTAKSASKHADHFATVAITAAQSCRNFDLDNVEIPYLSSEQIERWISELTEAKQSLDSVLKTLKSMR